MTCEQMKENFEKVGWSNIHFEEITKEIALKEGLTFAISGIDEYSGAFSITSPAIGNHHSG